MKSIKMTKAKAWVATVANAAAVLVAFVAPDTVAWKVLTAIILLAGAIGVYQVPNKLVEDSSNPPGVLPPPGGTVR